MNQTETRIDKINVAKLDNITILMNNENFSDSKRYIIKKLTRYPNSFTLLSLSGQLLMAKGNLLSATKLFDAAIELKQSNNVTLKL